MGHGHGETRPACWDWASDADEGLGLGSWGMHSAYRPELVQGCWGVAAQLIGRDNTNERISTQIYLACSPEFAVGNFAPTCREPAFGKARLAILKCLLACSSLFFYGKFARNIDFS